MANINPVDRRKKLLARIHILANELGYNEDDYRSQLEKWTGQRTCQKLDDYQLRMIANSMALMQRQLQAEYFGTATNKQKRHIRFVQRKLGWDDSALRGFIKHVTGLEHERFLTVATARELITGLRKKAVYDGIEL